MTRHPHVWMGLLLWSIFSQAQAAWTTNMAPGATEVSHAVFDLHMTIFWICVVIGIIVFGAMFWSMIVHRRSTGQVAAKFHESTTVEILWTVVPLLILMGVLLERSRLAQDLLLALGLLLRGIPGGTALSVTVMSVLFAAITGVVGASVIVMTLLALPPMLRAG